MHRDILNNKWKAMRPQLKVTWSKLTDDDLDRVAGRFSKFVDLLKEKYGYSQERAEEEVDRQIDAHEIF